MNSDYTIKRCKLLTEAAYKFSVMQHHSDHSFILRSNGLEFYETYFKKYNSSHLLPYHNAYHAECMVLNCWEGSVHEKLNAADRRSLLVAALFHDFNHTGGKESDHANVTIAVAGLISAHEFVVKSTEGLPLVGDFYARLTAEELKNAIETIKITKYPYEEGPQTIMQKIIRDADLMQVYEPDEYLLLRQYLGLKTEMEISRDTSFSVEEWAEGVSKFNLDVTWNTDWARQKAEVLDHEGRIKTLKRLLLGYR